MGGLFLGLGVMVPCLEIQCREFIGVRGFHHRCTGFLERSTTFLSCDGLSSLERFSAILYCHHLSFFECLSELLYRDCLRHRDCFRHRDCLFGFFNFRLKTKLVSLPPKTTSRVSSRLD